MMKINRTAWQEKEPFLYKQINLKTYETADYDEPYIAGVFNQTQLLTVGDFVLGKLIFTIIRRSCVLNDNKV